MYMMYIRLYTMLKLLFFVVIYFASSTLAKHDDVLRFEREKHVPPENELVHMMALLRKSFVPERYKPISFFKNLGLDHSKKLQDFEWKDCGDKGSIAHITSLSLLPDPLVLTGNITLTIKGSIVEDLSQNLMASLSIKKKVAGIPIEIPCVGNIGSCTYDNICSLLGKITECPDFLVKHNIPCKCPLKKGDYKLLNTTIPVNLGSERLSGDYEITGILTDKDKQKTACLDVKISIQ